MTSNSVTVEAVFEDGMLRPVQPLSLAPHQRVSVTLQLPGAVPAEWPNDVAAIYQEIADEDRRLANAMFASIQETWPAAEKSCE